MVGCERSGKLQARPYECSWVNVLAGESRLVLALPLDRVLMHSPGTLVYRLVLYRFWYCEHYSWNGLIALTLGLGLLDYVHITKPTHEQSVIINPTR